MVTIKTEIHSDEFSPASDLDDEDQEFEAPHTPKPKRRSTAGRKLKRWNPSEDQLVLLSIEYMVTRDGIPLDWNAVAKVVEPNGSLSGQAIKQHLAKVRTAREEAGEVNPPELKKTAAMKNNRQSVVLSTPKSSTQKAKIGAEKKPMAKWSGSPLEKRKTSGLLYQTPLQDSKLSTIETERGTSPLTPIKSSRKRKLDADQEMGVGGKLNADQNMDVGSKLSWNNDSNNNFSSVTKQVDASRAMKANGSPKKMRRSNLTNFPDGEPSDDSPSSDGPVGSGGTWVTLRSQPRVDYALAQLEDDATGAMSYNHASQVTLGQDVGVGPQLSSTSATMGEWDHADQMQIDLFTGSQACRNLFIDSAGNDPLPAQPIPIPKRETYQGAKVYENCTETDPLFNDYGFHNTPRSMMPEMQSADHDYGGTWGSMPGVGLGGETGVFQMDPFSLCDQSQDYDIGDDFGGCFELFGGPQTHQGQSFF